MLTLTAAASSLPDRLVLSTIVFALAATAGWRMMRALRQHAEFVAAAQVRQVQRRQRARPGPAAGLPAARRRPAAP